MQLCGSGGDHGLMEALLSCQLQEPMVVAWLGSLGFPS